MVRAGGPYDRMTSYDLLDVLIDLLCLLYFYVDIQIEIQNRNKLSWLKLFVAFLCLFYK